jgi:thiosulfate dehydrogenase [quinone] large subunit
MTTAPAPLLPVIGGPRSIVPEPPFATFLFADARTAWLWLVVRLYLAYLWLEPALQKLTAPAWTGAGAGSAILGFVKRALTHTGGEHADVTGWYAAFLQHVVAPNAAVFSYLIVGGELLVGLGLLLGAFTGVAAFFGLTMNASYLLGGTISTNPVLAIIAIFVVLAWRNAGWIGLDRFLLPAIGTPWQPGKLDRRNAVPVRPAPAAG